MRTLISFGCLITIVCFGAWGEDGDVFDRVDHHFVDNDGVKIHYASLGEGPVILFVHGFPDFWYSWRHQMDGLSDSFKCVAMDTRAYNQSDKPEGVSNYDMEFLLSDITAIIDDLGVKSVTLVGHDWGGAISWAYTMENQERVNRLIICNLTHPKGYGAVRANATEEQKANTNYIEQFQKPDAHKRFNAEMMAGFVSGPDPEVRKKYVTAFENSSIEGMLNYYKAAFPRITGELVTEMPDITCPVLQFHGLQDKAVDKQGLRDTWEWIASDYTLVTIPSCGHWVQRDAADMVTDTMRWWLLSRTSAGE